MASETNGCPVFDSDGNLYLFGTRGDFSVSSDLGRATRIKATDQRPTFETKNLQCMSSYNLKTVYFLNADDSGNKLYYYDFKAQRYGFVELTGQGPDMATVQAIIDYDTLVIYAYAKGEMKRLGDAQDLNLSKQPSSLPWIQANKNVVPPNFNPEYVATLTHAHFNLFFYGVPNTRDGQVWAFRIHFGEFGPEPTSLNSNFKTIKGQAATFQFKYPEQSEHGGAPAHVAFIPDDSSGVYVTNSYINQTISLPKPIDSSPACRYAGSKTKLVQFNPKTGRVHAIDVEWLARKADNPGVEWVASSLDLGTVTSNTNPTIGNSFAESSTPHLPLIFLWIFMYLARWS